MPSLSGYGVIKSLFDKIKVMPLIVIFLILSSPTIAQEACGLIPQYYDDILKNVSAKKEGAISSLYDCFKRDRVLILKAVVIDPSQFQYADESLQEDQVFILRLLKISPEVLQYASPEVRLDPDFMQKATYLHRNALQHASWTLLDNKIFMQRMIEIDPFNYKFASDRLKLLPEFASKAFKDNGLLLEFAPTKIKEDKNFVKIAVASNAAALAFASESLQADEELKKLAITKTSVGSLEELQNFLRENYAIDASKKELGKVIGNQGKFFGKNKIIDHNYVTKWQRKFNGQKEDWRLISASSRNYQDSWRNDFKKYPALKNKIEKFFLEHNIAENTIDNLDTLFLWRVKNKPLTLVFNLYLLRDSTDDGLGSEFVDVTSLTAIAQFRNKKWEMTVVEVIFDSEEKTDVSYEDGLKRYDIWDLYLSDKKDKNPKIIFKVNDKFRDHFEVFEEQQNGKYQKIYASSAE